MTLQDAELVSASRRGDREAFGELLRRYRDAVFGLAYHRVGDFATAEDLTQDAFVRAYTRLGELRDPARFAPWLMAIARNQCAYHIRSCARAAAASDAEPCADGPEGRVADEDLVHRALSALPAENGLAITLFYVNGYSYADIANLLTVPVTTVKGRIERGRSQMREEMVSMMREHLEDHKPGEAMTEMVIERISAAEVWGRPPGSRTEHLGARHLLVDGELVERRFSGNTGSTTLKAETHIWSIDRAPLCVFQLGNSNRYYVFGRAKVHPDGPLVENQLIEVSVRVDPVAGGLIHAEPWQPEEVASSAIWAMPPEERDQWLLELHQRSRGIIMLDGGPAYWRLINGSNGCGTCSVGLEVYMRNCGQHILNVYRGTWPAVRYYLFGEAEITPPGFRAQNTTISLQAVMEGSISEGCRQNEAPRLPEFSSHDLWALSPEAQAERLCKVNWVARIDGEVCTVKLTGGHGTNLVASTDISTMEGEAWALYCHMGDQNRYYVFGKAALPGLGMAVSDQVIDTRVTVAPASETDLEPTHLPDISSAELCALCPPERDRFIQCLQSNARVMLDGGLAEAILLNGPPGCSCMTPGEEVQFTNVGKHSLHVYLRRWPSPKYYVFGEAEASPPGLKVKDAVMTLEGRRD